jgi:hypothetical protein
MERYRRAGDSFRWANPGSYFRRHACLRCPEPGPGARLRSRIVEVARCEAEARLGILLGVWMKGRLPDAERTVLCERDASEHPQNC